MQVHGFGSILGVVMPVIDYTGQQAEATFKQLGKSIAELLYTWLLVWIEEFQRNFF